VYARTRAGMLAEATREVPYRIYVPNSESETVTLGSSSPSRGPRQ
jgi:hypothetical protein